MAIFDRLWLYFDPVAFILVIAGSVLLALVRSSRSDIFRAFRALGPLLRANPVADAEAAMRAVRQIEHIAHAKTIYCTDRVRTTQRFLTTAAIRLADSADAEAFAHWAEEDLENRRRRHQGAIDFWNTVADAAPAMGMVGTIIGLVGMFAAMNDADRIGPAMALAMLTTLYGLLLANLIAAPIAQRLERLSADEATWQRRVLDQLETLAQTELEKRISPARQRLKATP